MIKRFTLMAVLLAAFGTAFAQQIVSTIDVEGDVNVNEDTIKSVMRTKEGQIYQEAQLTRDRQSIEAMGFFQDVRVFGQLLQDNTYRVVVQVVEWPKIEEIDISGNTVFDDTKILDVFAKVSTPGIQPGQVLNVSLLDKAATAISELYRTEGYFARISKFEPDSQKPTKLLVEIVEARVSKITIEPVAGSKLRTRRSIFDKLIDTKEGDLLNQRTWSEDLRRIVDTRWFDSIDPDSNEPDLGKVELIVRVQEGRTGLFNVGLQVDPRNNLAGLLTLTETNLKGTGKSVGINLLQSAQGLGTSLSLDYGDPFLDDRRTALNASIYSRQSLVFGGSLFGIGGGSLNEEDRFSQRRTGGSIGISRPFNNETRGNIGIKAENIDTINFTPDPGEEFIVQDGDVATLMLGVVRNRRDNSVDPSRGDWLRLAFEPSYSNISSVGGLTTGYPILGSNFFGKFIMDFRKYFSSGPARKPEEFDQPRKVIATRIFAGYIAGEVPFVEQFFVGGSNGVRGYAEDRFWGRNAFLAQLEYRYPIQQSFNIIGFVDYGGAWNGYGTVREFTQSPNLNLHLGYGIGINFKTPFGPIRLDLGFDDKGNPRTHFLIGGSF
ncbi:MAG: BamA/OMP85 family outer membrane protein [Fimbriimonadales bacterium]